MSPSGKARGFDPRIPRFESWHPSKILEKNMKLFCGNANPEIAKSIAESLGVTLGNVKVGRFSDGEISVDLNESVRGQDVFIVQSICAPTNDHLMELIIMADAFRRSSAASISAVIPYLGYARQDRRIRSARVPITAKVVADMLVTAGINRIIVADLHADQIQGFFNIPVDNLYASPVMLSDMQSAGYSEATVVSPDVGGVVRARAFAKRLNDADLVIIDKRRSAANKSEVMHVIGDVKGKRCVLVDDIIDTGGTLCNAASMLVQEGAQQVSAYCTHPVLSGPAIDNINNSVLTEVVVGNTIPLSEGALACEKIRVLGLGPFFAQAIMRVIQKKSVSQMFKDSEV